MSGNQWLAYTVGIVVGVVVGVATAGIGLAAYAGTVGVLAFGVTSSLIMANGQKGMNGLAAAPDKLDIASATEIVPVPVTFGLVRVPGNFMRYDQDSFQAVAVEQEAQGGKGGGGGGSQIVGYKYYLSYLYGLCVGPVDGIWAIWDGNNLKRCDSSFVAFSSDTQLRTLNAADFSGQITIYRGSYTQPAAAIGGLAKVSDQYTYRGTCYAWFENYFIGSSPSPKTILFEVLRWPKCVDDAGATIASIITTGSLDNTGRTWYDANAAAILFEIFTNKVWGRAFPIAKLDVDSFAVASQFLATNDLGISLSLTDQGTLGDIVDYIRRHLNIAVVWDGKQLRCVVLMNSSDTTQPMVITREQVNKPSLSRPAWTNTANELRAEFTNRLNGWQSEIAHCQDDANIGAIGGIVNSQKVSLPGFTNRTTAESQTMRILGEMSYPQATLTFYMNRWGAKMLPGQRIMFVWDEFSGQALNTFWRVVEFSDNEQSADGIRVTLAEDLNATAYKGAEVPFAPVDPGFTGGTFNDDADVSLAPDANDPYDPGSMQPLRAWELPIGKSLGTRMFAVLCERGGFGNAYARHSWALHGGATFTTFAQTSCWAITGALTTALPITAREIHCGAFATKFQFSLNDPDNEAALLSSANKVLLDSDHLDVLLSGMTDMMVIGDEVFFIGKIVEISAGVYEASNFIRAQMGTDQAAHAIGDAFHFVSIWNATAAVVSQGDIPDGSLIDFQTDVVTPQSGVLQTAFPWVGPAAGAFNGTGAKAFCPAFISRTIIGLAWTINLRPRFHNFGADSASQLADMLGNICSAIPDGYSFYFQPFNGVTSLAARAPFLASYTPDSDPTYAGGVLSATINVPATTDSIRVWAAYKGGLSLTYITIS